MSKEFCPVRAVNFLSCASIRQLAHRLLGRLHRQILSPDVLLARNAPRMPNSREYNVLWYHGTTHQRGMGVRIPSPERIRQLCRRGTFAIALYHQMLRLSFRRQQELQSTTSMLTVVSTTYVV